MKLLLLTLILLIGMPVNAFGQDQEERQRVDHLNGQALAAYQAGDLDTAISIFEQAYRLTQASWRMDDPQALQIINNLGTVYLAKSRFADAEPLLVRAVQSRMRVLGLEHLHTLSSMESLSALYRLTSRLEEAASLSQQTLEVYQRILGPKHTDTMRSTHNLAALYRILGRFTDAEPLFLRALDIRQKVLGPEHRDTLQTVNSLGVLYKAMGRLAEAEALHRRALLGFTHVLGPEHPSTLYSVGNLGSVLLRKGQYGDAERLIRQQLEGRKRVRGPEHYETLSSLASLAALYGETGRFSDAESVLVAVLETQERMLGAAHHRTLSSMHNLANVVFQMGHFARAEALLGQALEGRERLLGPDHPSTLSTVSGLAVLYERTGRFSEAETLHLRALQAYDRTLGAEHPQTLMSLSNLAALLQGRQRFSEAESLYARALEARTLTQGFNHPDTLQVATNLASLFQATDRFVESKELYERALNASEQALGSDHPKTLTALFGLAAVYQDKGSTSKALPLWRQALEASERVLGPEHPTTQAKLMNFSVLQTVVGDSEAVAAAAAALDQTLNTSALRVDSEIRAGANDSIRAYFGTENPSRDLSISIAIKFPEHFLLGARALLLAKGVAGETDAALNQLVAGSRDTEIQEAAEALQNAEAHLQISYQTDDPDRIWQARQRRDMARRELFGLIEPPPALVPTTISPDVLVESLSDGELFLDYGIYFSADFANRRFTHPRIVLAAYRSSHDVRLMDLGPVSNISESIVATSLTENRTLNLGRKHWILRKTLLDPIRDMLEDTKEVIVAPDGILARVNFALLQDPDNHNQHLIERLPVRIVSNGRSLLPPRSIEPPQPESDFLGVGITDFGPHDPERCSHIPERNAERGLCPLPNAVREIERVANLFTAAEQPVIQLLLEAQATKAAVTAAMPSTRIIHLATHGGELLPESEGAGLHNVGLALHGVGAGMHENLGGTNTNDGFLSGYEVARLPLWGTDLVVLSACDTALGEAAGSEGIWSMAHAFRLAGAKAVMMTLWNVSDESAPAFMERFHQMLLERQDRTPSDTIETTLRTAFRDTQLWAIRQGWSYWDYGPFVLMEK